MTKGLMVSRIAPMTYDSFAHDWQGGTAKLLTRCRQETDYSNDRFQDSANRG